MLRINVTTKLSPEEAIKKAAAFFGPNGYRLKIVSQTSLSVCLEDVLGSIEIDACEQDGKTSVEFVSREFDELVKEFIRKIKS
jgi:hypothetical protein